MFYIINYTVINFNFKIMESMYLMLLIVTGSTKTVLNRTFGNSRNTDLKY